VVADEARALRFDYALFIGWHLRSPVPGTKLRDSSSLSRCRSG
jgi:hypothetical protein